MDTNKVEYLLYHPLEDKLEEHLRVARKKFEILSAAVLSLCACVRMCVIVFTTF